MSNNRIDDNIDKVVHEVTSSVWVKSLFKLILAILVTSFLATVAFVVTDNMTGDDQIGVVVSWIVGLIVFFGIMLKK